MNNEKVFFIKEGTDVYDNLDRLSNMVKLDMETDAFDKYLCSVLDEYIDRNDNNLLKTEMFQSEKEVLIKIMKHVDTHNYVRQSHIKSCPGAYTFTLSEYKHITARLASEADNSGEVAIRAENINNQFLIPHSVEGYNVHIAFGVGVFGDIDIYRSDYIDKKLG
jgi:uncharacterized protein YeeX (DUF496 family)